MSVAIQNCKGIVHVIADPQGGGTGGFYSLDPPIPDGAGSKALILGVPLGLQEIVQPSVTLDDKRILYVFGTAWNEVSVAGVLLLGEARTRGDQLTKLINWYEQNRVSKKRAAVRVSLGTTGLSAYVVGLRLDQADPVFNKQMFSIHMLTAEINS